LNSPEYARTTKQRYRLEGSNCSGCGIKHFPPREVCPDCGRSSFGPRVLFERSVPEPVAKKTDLIEKKGV